MKLKAIIIGIAVLLGITNEVFDLWDRFTSKGPIIHVYIDSYVFEPPPISEHITTEAMKHSFPLGKDKLQYITISELMDFKAFYEIKVKKDSSETIKEVHIHLPSKGLVVVPQTGYIERNIDSFGIAKMTEREIFIQYWSKEKLPSTGNPDFGVSLSRGTAKIHFSKQVRGLIHMVSLYADEHPWLWSVGIIICLIAGLLFMVVWLGRKRASRSLEKPKDLKEEGVIKVTDKVIDITRTEEGDITVTTKSYDLSFPSSLVGEPSEYKLEKVKGLLKSTPGIIEKTRKAYEKPVQELLKKRPEALKDPQFADVFPSGTIATAVNTLSSGPIFKYPEDYKPKVVEPEKIYEGIKRGKIIFHTVEVGNEEKEDEEE